MKRFVTILAVLLTLAVTGRSQELQQYKYGLYDDYFVNPAYVGTPNYYTLMLGHDTKFSGLKGASPRTYYLSLHSRVGQGYLFEKGGKINKFFSKFGNTAFGFQGFVYNYGPKFEYNLGLTYGYHIDLQPNLNTKLPRKLVLAFTPRLMMVNYDRSRFVDDDGQLLTDIDDPIFPADLDGNLFHMGFKLDVGALFQTTYYDIGLSWLNLNNGRSGFESDTIIYGRTKVENDTVTTYTGGYGIYDSIYSSTIGLDAKLKFLNLIKSNKFDVNFLPNLRMYYKPNSRDYEVAADFRFDMNLYDVITSARRKLMYNLQAGANVVYTRFYRPTLVIQPYVAFDFLNFKMYYTYQFNPSLKIPGYWGRNQVAFVYQLGRDKFDRDSDKSSKPILRKKH